MARRIAWMEDGFTDALEALAARPANDPASTARVERLSGAEALDTMVEIVKKAEFALEKFAVLVTSEGYWDALTAAGLAGMVDAPIIMTPTNALASQAKNLLAELKPTTLIVCGGTAAVSDKVVEAARKGEMSINAAYKTVAPTPAPKKAAPEPQDGFAIVADIDAPEGEERDTEPPRAVSVEAAPEPVKRIKNWQRFANRDEATKAHAAEKIVFGCGWGEIEWLYMDYIPGEPRIDYLRRLSKHGILKSEGHRELKRLEKAEKKGATK
jgi:hypothetical protein